MRVKETESRGDGVNDMIEGRKGRGESAKVGTEGEGELQQGKGGEFKGQRNKTKGQSSE